MDDPDDGTNWVDDAWGRGSDAGDAHIDWGTGHPVWGVLPGEGPLDGAGIDGDEWLDGGDIDGGERLLDGGDVAGGERLLDGGDVAGGEHPAEDDGEDPSDEGGAGERTSRGSGRVPLLSVPESLRSLDVQVGVRAVRGLLLLLVVVVLVLGGRWWWVQQGADAVPVAQVHGEEDAMADVAPVEGGSDSSGPATEGAEDGGQASPGQGEDGAGSGGGDPGAADDGSAKPGAGSVVVHVVGEVRHPGVVELPAGARVADAVAAAGGLTDAADQASLNLARALVDGEQVWVGAPGEEPPPGFSRAPVTPGAAGGPGTGEGTGGGAAGTGSGQPVDLNLATQAQLEELPGIGPVTAGRVLAWREEHGRFSTVEELMEVSGIGERTFAQLEPLVTVGG